jgi:hypothetical protein
MAGAGRHLHRLLHQLTGQGFTPGCGCKEMIRRMNANGPAWCRKHIDEIVAKMRGEARKRRWWKIIMLIPGTNAPMRWMVFEAIRRSEADGN